MVWKQDLAKLKQQFKDAGEPKPKAQAPKPPPKPEPAGTIEDEDALFLNAKGEHRLFIAKRCQRLIHCLEGLTYRGDTMEPDKRLGLDHLPDALGYLVHSEFPLIRIFAGTVRITGI